MCLLVSWCIGGKCDMVDNDEDQGRRRRLSAEDLGWSGTSQVLGGQMIERSGDTVWDLHRTHGGDEKHGFSDLASKPVAMVCQRFSLKTTATVIWFGSQNQGQRFGDLGLKIITTVSWFEPQNQVGGYLLVCSSKSMTGWRWYEDTCWYSVACFVVKQVRLGFPSFISKLAKERWWVVYMASSRRSRESEAKDGRFDGVGCGAVKSDQTTLH
jgi:hypothetical protein